MYYRLSLSLRHGDVLLFMLQGDFYFIEIKYVWYFLYYGVGSNEIDSSGQDNDLRAKCMIQSIMRLLSHISNRDSPDSICSVGKHIHTILLLLLIIIIVAKMAVIYVADNLKWGRRIWSVIYCFTTKTNCKQI